MGTVLSFVHPDSFKYATYASVLGGAGVLANSFRARGWYDPYLDASDPTKTSAEKLDPEFTNSKNYLLYGGLAAVVVDVFAIVFPLISGTP